MVFAIRYIEKFGSAWLVITLHYFGKNHVTRIMDCWALLRRSFTFEVGKKMAAKLINSFFTALNNNKISYHLLTDSMIVLAWLKATPNKWQNFVANRVSFIQSSTKPTALHHLKSSDNPADCGSCETYPSELANQKFWWHVLVEQYIFLVEQYNISNTRNLYWRKGINTCARGYSCWI